MAPERHFYFFFSLLSISCLVQRESFYGNWIQRELNTVHRSFVHLSFLCFPKCNLFIYINVPSLFVCFVRSLFTARMPQQCMQFQRKCVPCYKRCELIVLKSVFIVQVFHLTALVLFIIIISALCIYFAHVVSLLIATIKCGESKFFKRICNVLFKIDFQHTLNIMWTIIQWLGVTIFSNADKLKWSKVSPLLVENNQETQRKINNFLDGYDALEQKIRYKFRNKAHLLQSVSHESFVANDLTQHYRGLDFVGDAILNYALIRHLFRQPNYLNANELNKLSGLLICNSCIATVSVRNNMHKYLRYTTPTIRGNINSFATFLQCNKFKPIDDVRANRK